MKISCEVIKDLLPLYHDNVCSTESELLVEKHLADCDNCKVELQDMVADISLTNRSLNMVEAEVIQKISKKWRRGMLKSFLKGALITILILGAIALVLFLFIDIRPF